MKKFTPCKRLSSPKMTKHRVKNNPDFQVREGQITFDSEGIEGHRLYHTRIPSVPPSRNSGVTLGMGYDMGNRSKNIIKKELVKAGVSYDYAEVLSNASGKKGGYNEFPHNKACKFLHENVGEITEISPRQQKKLFELIYPSYLSRCIEKIYKTDVVEAYGVLDWVRLDGRIKDLLVDLEYRGDFGKGARKWLLPPLIDNDLAGLFAAVSKREWQGPIGGFVPRDRFLKRIKLLRAVDQLYSPIKSELLDNPIFNLTFELENEKMSLHPLYDASKQDIQVGMGFSLKYRQCQRYNRNYTEYKTYSEVKNYFKAIVGDESMANRLAQLTNFKSKHAIQEYLSENPDLMLTTLQAKHLFLLMCERYQGELIALLNNKVLVEKYGAVDWYGLDAKMKAVLFDMFFTNHFRYKVANELLYPHLSNNDLFGFRECIQYLKNNRQYINENADLSAWHSRFDRWLQCISI